MKQIAIKSLSDTSLRVGNKVVYRDQHGNWIARTELTAREAEAFNAHLQNQEI